MSQAKQAIHKVTTSLLLLLGVVMTPRLAYADGAACLNAHEQSQVLRMQAKLLEAREQMRRCSDEDCPSVIRKDCARWLDEVATQMPTIVLEAVSKDGAESDVKVYANGKLLTDKLDGVAIELNPGAYEFRFELPGEEPKTQRVILKQGEHNRSVTADFRPPPDPNAPGAGQPIYAGPREPEQPKGTPTRPIPVLTWVLGGVAVAGAGVATYFGLEAMSKKDDAKNACYPTCSDDTVDEVKTQALISDIGTGVAAAAALGAVIVVLTRPTVYVEEKPPAEEKKSDISWSLGFTPGNASVSVGSRF